jgi:hypothetical protein
MICSVIMKFDFFDDHSPSELFRMTFVAFAPLNLCLGFIALFIDIMGKWVILGRRQAGEYPWDMSPYCQRWQIYLTLQEIRRGERHKTGILDMIQGSAYLVWYFRALGANIGNNVCLFPNGGDPMMTEPDLVTIGDFVGIDEASVIAHINTRGIFRLNPLKIGTGCILKPMSRLLSGATMESHSILLEHTLVLAGEVVSVGSVWQGWPTRTQLGLKDYRSTINRILDRISYRYRLEYASSASRPMSALSGLRSNSRSRILLEEEEMMVEEGPKRSSTTTQSSGGRTRGNSAGNSSETDALLPKSSSKKQDPQNYGGIN